MALTVTKTSTGGLDIDQYDFVLGDAELEDGKFGEQIKLTWTVDGETDSAGDPKTQYDWVPAGWGSPTKPYKLRKRVYALAGGTLNTYIDAVLSLDPGAIDIEWFYGMRVAVDWGERPKVDMKGNPVGGTKLDMLSVLPVRQVKDAQRKQFLECMAEYAPEVHAKAAAIAGITVAAPAKTNGVRPGAIRPLPADGEAGDDLPF
jgi:hypothetical protein